MKGFLKIIIILFLSASLIAIMQYCKKPSAPTVTTAAVSEITQTTALSGGNITNNGGDEVTARGVCWATTSNPAISSSKTSDGTGNGSFASNITGLTANTTYHVRAYATNSEGTAYGDELTFTTIAVASTVPGAPTIGTATAGNAQASVAFTAPAIDGGSAITGYMASSSPGGLTGAGTASPITVTGLTNGTAYTFTVTATNANGTGPASSASNSVTPSAPLTVPGAPTIGTATAGNAQATITFTAPANNGGSAITGYTVTSSPGGFTATGSASPITVTGLSNGIAYTFTVTATNANGIGPASSASNSVTLSAPSTVPGAPTIGTATKGNAQAAVTFTAPASNGGSTITGYTVTSSPGGIIATGSGSPITVTGLTNGTAYTFTVTATNVNGTGPASSPSNSVTPLLTDIDGNVYNIVTIGTQVWMTPNLRTTKYSDGTPIPNITDNTTWGLSTGAYCDYSNTPANSITYGRLYNWYAVDNNAATKVASNGGKNVCPTSWHVPSDDEWTTLITYLGGESVAGGKLKETGAFHWYTPNTGATNETGFTALPGGLRDDTGVYNEIGLYGNWWSSTDRSVTYAWMRYIYNTSASVNMNGDPKRYGFSVRCVRD